MIPLLCTRTDKAKVPFCCFGNYAPAVDVHHPIPSERCAYDVRAYATDTRGHTPHAILVIRGTGNLGSRSALHKLKSKTVHTKCAAFNLHREHWRGAF